MSHRELYRIEIIQKLTEKRLIETEAAALQLDLSFRQIRRLKRTYSVDGAKGHVTTKRKKRSNHKYPDSPKELAITYVREQYSDFQPTFACEKLTVSLTLFLTIY